MITELELERIASAIERVIRNHTEPGWPQVERLRLQADLLDRLAAAQRYWSGSLSGRAEMVRDAAEQLSDELNRVDSALAKDSALSKDNAMGRDSALSMLGVGLVASDSGGGRHRAPVTP